MVGAVITAGGPNDRASLSVSLRLNINNPNALCFTGGRLRVADGVFREKLARVLSSMVIVRFKEDRLPE